MDQASVSETQDRAQRMELVAMFALDPFLAHETLFHKNHSHATPRFHQDMLNLYHSSFKHVLMLTFRGSAKSTRLEEYVVLLAVQNLVNNILIVGESWLRAVERLRSIKRELVYNEQIRYLYGEQQGETWSEARIVLANGCAISAIGQGQALRGMKHHIYRPDLCLVDDLESQDTVATPEARQKLKDWFWADLIPALDPNYKLRMTATPLDRESLAVVLSASSAFKTMTIPIRYIDNEGVSRSSWPSRWSTTAITELEQSYIEAGETRKFVQEYMVQAVDPSLQLFKIEYFKFDECREHDWEPVLVAIDPARTVTKTSATTGIIVASFLGNKLIIWEARAERYTPRDIIEELFRLEDKYHPVAIGVEKDGLEEFLMQPVREEELKRRQLLPIRALKAPRGKDEFISRLQPLFVAGSVVFAGPLDKFKTAVDQFLSFPAGLKDVPNAAAYMFEMRQGAPVYTDASYMHLASSCSLLPTHYSLAVNAGSYGTVAILIQYQQKTLVIHRDWVADTLPGECIASFVDEARMHASKPVQVIVPPYHFDSKNSYGLIAALKGVSEVRKGGDPLKGREIIRDMLRGETRGMPKVVIGEDAVWTRRALYGGFVWDQGRVKPKDSLHEHVMTALEGAIAPVSYTPLHTQHVAFTPDGRKYATAEVRWDTN